jgi:hypothetical protein
MRLDAFDKPVDIGMKIRIGTNLNTVAVRE